MKITEKRERHTVADPEFFEGGRKIMYQHRHTLLQVHNELYAFHTGKAGLL